MKLCVRTLLLAMLTIAQLHPATAGADDKDQAAIRAALEQWTADFNARRADKICDLFEPEAAAHPHAAPPAGGPGGT